MGGDGRGDEERLNATAYNNAYVNGRLGFLRHAGAMRLITHKARLAGVKLPASTIDLTCKACPAFHIKGMCIKGCGNVADHVPHTQEKDPPCWGWDLQAIPDIKAPAAPIAYEIVRGLPRCTVSDHNAEASTDADEDLGAGCEATDSVPSSASGKTAV